MNMFLRNTHNNRHPKHFTKRQRGHCDEGIVHYFDPVEPSTLDDAFALIEKLSIEEQLDPPTKNEFAYSVLRALEVDMLRVVWISNPALED